jgi:hypothetical protein
MRVAQTDGELDPALSPNALAHFCLLLSMGSALITPDLHEVDDDGWTALLSRIVSALAPGNTSQTERSTIATTTASAAQTGETP